VLAAGLGDTAAGDLSVASTRESGFQLAMTTSAAMFALMRRYFAHVTRFIAVK
jgi:hypothetical protein